MEETENVAAGCLPFQVGTRHGVAGRRRVWEPRVSPEVGSQVLPELRDGGTLKELATPSAFR